MELALELVQLFVTFEFECQVQDLAHSKGCPETSSTLETISRKRKCAAIAQFFHQLPVGKTLVATSVLS